MGIRKMFLEIRIVNKSPCVFNTKAVKNSLKFSKLEASKITDIEY
jgi:hypothetical protein